jgi:hypothetical protein
MLSKTIIRSNLLKPSFTRAFATPAASFGPKKTAGATAEDGTYVEPRFLENVQLMVENAAGKANI